MNSFRMSAFMVRCCLLLIATTTAQAVIKATVDRPSIFMGESLTLTIKSDQNTNAQPDFTLLDAVFHVGQTGKSSSTQIINGSVSTETAWQVLLVPKSLGTHIIPPLEVDGELTETIKIEVKKPNPNTKVKGDIFIEVETDKDSAFVQEEILLTVRLLYAINLKSGALSEPGADGLIVQQINKGANYTTQRNGKTYQVLERKYAIFAENSGPLTLNPLVFEGEVTDNSRQSLGLFQRGRPVRQVSSMLDLEIKQIPQSFVSQAWIPAKQVVLQQSWSQNKPYKVGEPITRSINLTVTGLSETQLPDLQLQDIEGAKIYQDKTETMTRSDGQQLIATKLIKYAVIPSEAGQLEIPEFTLEWYDTANQVAQRASIPASTLAVSAADASTTGTPKAIDFNPDSSSVTAVPEVSDVSIHSSEKLQLWQTLTFGFAILWILTLVLFGLKIKGRPAQVVAKRKTINQISISNLNQATPAHVQITLLAWWNHEYQQQVTNLGQIRDQLSSGPARQAIADLQQQLYTDGPATAKVDWQKMIKQGNFQPAKPDQTLGSGLPELYE